MDICLRALKESKKSRFDSCSVRDSILIISHITFRDCRVQSFSGNLSRTSCISFCLPVLQQADLLQEEPCGIQKEDSLHF